MKKIILALVTMTIFASAAFADNSMVVCHPVIADTCTTITVSKHKRGYKLSSDATSAVLRAKYKKNLVEAALLLAEWNKIELGGRKVGKKYNEVLVGSSKLVLGVEGDHPEYKVIMIPAGNFAMFMGLNEKEIEKFISLLDAVDNS